MKTFIIICCLVSATIVLPAAAEWSAQLAQEWGDIPSDQKAWFCGVKSPQGVPCCSAADGHKTGYEQRAVSDPKKESGYWVQIKGEWQAVPPEAVVRNTPNPTGSAIVWYVQQGRPDQYYIRCFITDAQG